MPVHLEKSYIFKVARTGEATRITMREGCTTEIDKDQDKVEQALKNIESVTYLNCPDRGPEEIAKSIFTPEDFKKWKENLFTRSTAIPVASLDAYQNAAVQYELIRHSYENMTPLEFQLYIYISRFLQIFHGHLRFFIHGEANVVHNGSSQFFVWIGTMFRAAAKNGDFWARLATRAKEINCELYESFQIDNGYRTVEFRRDLTGKLNDANDTGIMINDLGRNTADLWEEAGLKLSW